MTSRIRRPILSCAPILLLLGLCSSASGAEGELLTVVEPAPGAGFTTTSPPGIVCETFFCPAEFPKGSTVTLTATPRKGFAFSGYAGGCTGPTCSVVMDEPRVVIANFVRFAVVTRSKLKRNTRAGTARLAIRAGGPGTLLLAGKKVERQEIAVATASNVTVPVAARGTAASSLEKRGSVTVSVKVIFTPTEGTAARLTRPVRLVRHAHGG